MNRLAVTGLVGLLAAGGCSSNEELEKKVAELEKDLEHTRKELDRRIDDLARETSNVKFLERKVDELARDVRRSRDLAVRPAPPPRRPEPDPGQTYAVPADGGAQLGPADAKITMIVAFDYACAYCEKAQETLAELRRKYGTNLRMVFRNEVIHPSTAMAPALAACAANKQGKFVQMDRQLWEAFRARSFDTNRCWEDPDGCKLMDGFARQIGLNIPRYKADMRACQSLVSDEMRDLSRFGVAATPSFFINGRFMSGAQSVDVFARLIDEELAKAEARIQAGTPKASYYKRHVIETGLPRLEQPAPTAIGVP